MVRQVWCFRSWDCLDLVALLVEQLPGAPVDPGSIPGMVNVFSVACGCYSVLLDFLV